jgi:2-succinyl-6-hydroxy-2,4-cyclohexadiene-1-carboxylate synthase
MERGVADLLALLDHLGLERTDLLGYSLGGRLALQFAVAAPDRLRRLVLESASPGLEGAAERRRRQADDAALADRIERDGLEAFVEFWERLPLFASQASLPDEARRRQRALRLQQRTNGLANSLRGMGTGAQPPLWSRLGTLPTPSLLVVGALDQKFLALGQQMAARLPDARLAVVPAAGHAVHLEQPAIFASLVAEFLEVETMGERG